jgi:hypothetical protein
MTSDGVFLAMFPTEELLFLGAVVFQFHGLKHCWLRASFDSANLWIGVRIKAGYYSFHSLEIQNDHWVLRSCHGQAMKPVNPRLHVALRTWRRVVLQDPTHLIGLSALELSVCSVFEHDRERSRVFACAGIGVELEPKHIVRREIRPIAHRCSAYTTRPCSSFSSVFT